MGEFELIQQYFRRAEKGPGVREGIGDDCAVLAVPVGQELVVSIDTLVEGTHFLSDIPPACLAERLLGAAVSDLAAAAAHPAWLTLALTLPEADTLWLESFAAALAQRCHELGIALVGGDTTRGPQLVLSAQVHGWVESGQALLRRGAQPGDAILVSGTLGDSRGGLETLLHPEAIVEDREWLQRRFYRPEPRVALARALRPWLHAGVDISDGLMADLGHVLEASGVGAEIEQALLPVSDQLQRSFPEQAFQWALTGGEDFELCLVAPASAVEACLQAANELELPLTLVGHITEARGLRVLDQQGQQVTGLTAGYDHFKESQ